MAPRRLALVSVVSVAAAVPAAGATGRPWAAPPPISATPRVIAWVSPSQLAGSFPTARHDDQVVIEARDCDSQAFTRALEISADPQGGWHVFVSPPKNTAYRARFRGELTDSVTVMVRPHIVIRELRRGRFGVTIHAFKQFWRRSAVLERFDRPTQRWRRVKTFVLDDTGAAGSASYSKATFRSTLPSGVLVRAVLPASQARPCYAAGVSNMLRTR